MKWHSGPFSRKMDDVGIQKMVLKSAHLRTYLQKVQAEILSEEEALPVHLKNS